MIQQFLFRNIFKRRKRDKERKIDNYVVLLRIFENVMYKRQKI